MKKIFTKAEQDKGLDTKFINAVAKSQSDKAKLVNNKNYIDNKGNRVIKLSKNGRV